MTVILFILALSALILVHELGHYLAARLFGVKAEEFGFGFPPRLFGIVREGGRWKKVGPKDTAGYVNTVWSINALPLGGFVKIKGESEDGLQGRDSIHAKPIWQRLAIIAAGVAMNWALAALIFTGLFVSGGRMMLDGLPANAKIADREVSVAYVVPDGPAAKAGIVEGDILASVAGTRPETLEDAKRLIAAQGTSTFAVVVERDGAGQTLAVEPAMIPEIGRPGIGVGMMDVGTVSFSLPGAVVQGVALTGRATVMVVQGFWGVVRGLVVDRQVPADVSGPVGIAVVAGDVAEQGLTPFLQFIAMLSVNLAVINFLPIPALDGGRAIFLIVEGIRRKPISRSVEIGIHNIAFLLLLVLMALITARDIGRL
jgi:regulator of sigma E protease